MRIINILFVALLLAACKPTQVATPAVDVNNGVLAPTPVLVAPELSQPAHKAAESPTIASVVGQATPAPRKKHKSTTALKKAEQAAYEKAWLNALTSNLLLGRVKYKVPAEFFDNVKS